MLYLFKVTFVQNICTLCMFHKHVKQNLLLFFFLYTNNLFITTISITFFLTFIITILLRVIDLKAFKCEKGQ